MDIEINGKTYEANIPSTFAERRELAFGWISNKYRGSAAIVGICIPELTTADYRTHGCDPMKFGATVWEELMDQGITEAEMIRVASLLFADIANALFPDDKEVEKKKRSSRRKGGKKTSRASG